MAMTKKTVYATDHVTTDEEKAQIEAKVAELVANGSTDGFYVVFDDRPPGSVTRRIRHWVDQEAAAAWEAWLTNFAATNGFDFSSFVISDI